MACYHKAKEHALKALSLGEVAEAHAILGMIARMIERNLGKAEAEIKKALELNPSYASGHDWYHLFLVYLNRLPEAWKEAKRGVELSPLSPRIRDGLVNMYFWQREFDKGIEEAKKAIEMNPSYPSHHITLAMLYLNVSKQQEVLKEVEAYTRLADPIVGKQFRAYFLSRMGRREEAEVMIRELEEMYPKMSVNPYWLACMLFYVGENDKGFEWLEKSFDDYDGSIFEMGIDPDLAGVRSDPRYLSLLGRTGIAQHLRR